MLRRRDAIDPVRHAALSRAIQTRLIASAAWAGSSSVLLYVAVRGEPDTSLLIDAAWAAGKNVYLPRVRPGDRGGMDMRICRRREDLTPSALGIPEPPASAPAFSPSNAPNALIVVPGLAFDRDGYRLGYGGGYYDRFLSADALPGVGLAFTDHLVDRLPRDPWDRSVSGLCTEEELIWL